MRERNGISFIGACFALCAMDIFACVLAMHIYYGLLFCVCVIVCVCVFVYGYLSAFALVCVGVVGTCECLRVCVRGWCDVEPNVWV